MASWWHIFHFDDCLYGHSLLHNDGTIVDCDAIEWNLLWVIVELRQHVHIASVRQTKNLLI